MILSKHIYHFYTEATFRPSLIKNRKAFFSPRLSARLRGEGKEEEKEISHPRTTQRKLTRRIDFCYGMALVVTFQLLKVLRFNRGPMSKIIHQLEFTYHFYIRRGRSRITTLSVSFDLFSKSNFFLVTL